MGSVQACAGEYHSSSGPKPWRSNRRPRWWMKSSGWNKSISTWRPYQVKESYHLGRRLEDTTIQAQLPVKSSLSISQNLATSRQVSSRFYQEVIKWGWPRDTWSHDQLLTKLSEVLEKCRVAANHEPASAQPAQTGFVKPGSTLQAPAQKMNTMFMPSKGWQMVVDFKKQLLFLREIITIISLQGQKGSSS